MIVNCLPLASMCLNVKTEYCTEYPQLAVATTNVTKILNRQLIPTFQKSQYQSQKGYEGTTSSNKKLLVAKCIATGNKCIAISSTCATSNETSADASSLQLYRTKCRTWDTSWHGVHTSGTLESSLPQYRK